MARRGIRVDQGLRTALGVYAFAVLGVFLVVAPWTAVWTHAVHALAPGAVEAWLLSGWVRGGVSGLGALDVLVAVQLALDVWSRRRCGP